MMIGNTGSCKIVSNKRFVHVLYIYAGATRIYSCTLCAVASRIFPLVVTTWSCSLSMSLCNLLRCSLPVVLAVDIYVYNLHGCLSGILYFRLNGEGATATISTLIYSAGKKKPHTIYERTNLGSFRLFLRSTLHEFCVKLIKEQVN